MLPLSKFEFEGLLPDCRKMFNSSPGLRFLHKPLPALPQASGYPPFSPSPIRWGHQARRLSDSTSLLNLHTNEQTRIFYPTFLEASSSLDLMALFKVMSSFWSSSNRNFSSELRELRRLNEEPESGAWTILVEPLPCGKIHL